MHVRLDSAQRLEGLGAGFAAAVTAGCVIYLTGPLGAGKTTFARGFIHAAGHSGAVKSPTYTLIESYSPPGRTIHHLDLYRLSDSGQLEFLGLRELVDSDAVLLVEWPERAADHLPPADLTVRIDITSASKRELHCEAKTAHGLAIVGRLVKHATN